MNAKNKVKESFKSFFIVILTEINSLGKFKTLDNNVWWSWQLYNRDGLHRMPTSMDHIALDGIKLTSISCDVIRSFSIVIV